MYRLKMGLKKDLHHSSSEFEFNQLSNSAWKTNFSECNQIQLINLFYRTCPKRQKIIIPCGKINYVQGSAFLIDCKTGSFSLNYRTWLQSTVQFSLKGNFIECNQIVTQSFLIELDKKWQKIIIPITMWKNKLCSRQYIFNRLKNKIGKHGM